MPVPDIEVISGTKPPILDSLAARAILSPLVAAAAWTAAFLRETAVESPIDPLALLLRLIALGVTVRAVLLGIVFARRLGVWLRARRWRLTIEPQRLRLVTPAGETTLARDEIVAIREHGDWRTRRVGRRWSDVYVVLDPRSKKTHVALPPVFERTPGELAERLMRWRGPVTGPEGHTPPAPPDLPSKLYDRAARGDVPPDVVVIPHGRGWLARGPYATVLLGAVILDGLARMPANAWTAIAPVAIVALGVSLVLVPVGWILLNRREIAPRRGLALLITPAEALMRTRSGILRVPWRSLKRMAVGSKPSWSILAGYDDARSVVFERDDAPIHYEEAFLGAPCEVVTALCEAYQRGVLPSKPGVGEVAPALGDGDRHDPGAAANPG